MNNKNGGLAFPDSDGQTGITLRDYFAAKAMVSLIKLGPSTNALTDGNEKNLTYAEWIAKKSYYMAAAMLAEREKTNEGN